MTDTRPKNRQVRALVADDDENVRSLMVRALQRQDFRCDEAQDGIIAENLMRLNRYEVLITDLRMPRKNGHALISEVLKSESPPMIVAVTAVEEPRIVADLVARGVSDVVTKPLTHDVFAAKVRALYDRRALLTAAGKHGNVEAVSQQIEHATSSLRNQLSDITKTFEETITNLEKQRENLEAGYLGSVRVLTNMLAQDDENTQGSHVGRVEEMAEYIARKIQLDRDTIRDIKVASLLHEIGQFGMPDSIRMKPPTQYTPEERKVYQKYPTISAALLAEIPGADTVVEFVESHAENWDGSGFPDGLAGEAVPLGSRIIRIADGYDTYSMFNQPDDPVGESKHYLFGHKGKYFDPELVEFAVEFIEDAEKNRKHEETIVLDAAHLEVGQVLAENVYDESGRFLARKGAELSRKLQNRLQHLVGKRQISVYAPGHKEQAESGS